MHSHGSLVRDSVLLAPPAIRLVPPQARDMYYASLAQELAAISDSRIRLLSYAPGPLETDMVEEIRAAEALDPGLRPNFAKQLLDPLVSARVLVQLVWSDKTDAFGNGQHVDYYDVVEGQSEGVAQGEVSNNTTVK
jgi:NAD(P)-dependent dehydrogenase (short-subunit alcohol dehydrogenase family)